MERKSAFIFLLVAFAILATHCKSHRNVKNDNPKGSPTTWMAVSINGQSIDDVDFMRGSPSIIFSDSVSLSGSTGCNQFSAKYTRKQSGIHISVGPMTKMACPGNEEQLFLDALQKTNRIEEKEDEVIFYENGTETLRFKKML